MSFLGDLMPYFHSSDEESDSDATVTTRYEAAYDREETMVRVPRVRIKKQQEEEIGEGDQEEVVRSKKIPLQIRRFGLPDEGHRVRLVWC